ncbi:hypothetical protein CPC735_069190 [Coccidioides posadasii C735 delta SOWgp]|uniref:Uncharacterized protein n=3 Tax=Coccidioides posadasii TaxID=199306 RepID=E9DFF8_COCPS|nr:hypothetical protein CPC735_069190 [Coccidioides posadasii C735 delta SOWgp]EER29237.1 hypothetical protein CPC735_069190 [Coccidioides posadasii C735 delta SOWgp]EFW14815.1 conserved hypothetical protein [Coccidioides posadasii str. Silveira]KMM70483.1 hypothetical protein CPAG_06794 [Coccidioides posadasii RMSCC 3488]|eukprot:XP_003071382.1 hypothetical protein CPC735_069190 [Coccidioides posadasii C735 delta SOWgp]
MLCSSRPVIILLWLTLFLPLGPWHQLCAGQSVSFVNNPEKTIFEAQAPEEPPNSLDKVPGNNPAYFCKSSSPFQVHEFILLPNPPKPSLQHFAYLTGWVPHIRDLELIRLSFTIWSGHFKRYGPYEYRLSEVPWIRIRQNFLLREYMAPGWAELLAENMLAGKNVEDGSYRVHAELLLPNRTSLLCMVADLVIRDGTMEF